MASRFWVDGAGNWSDTAHWSLTTGGAGGETVPTSSDDVTLDGSSGVGLVTVDVTGACKNLDMSAYGGTFKLNAGLSPITGNVTLPTSAITLTGSFGLSFSQVANALTMTFNGCTVNGSVVIGNIAGDTGSVTFLDTSRVNNTVTLTRGTLNTNGQTCSWGSFSSSNSNARTLTLGASAITITGTGTPWNTSTTTGLTITANTATATLSGAAAIFSGGPNWNGMSIVLSGSGAQQISASATQTFANVTRTGTAVKTDSFVLNGGFTVTGTCTLGGNTTQGVNRLLVQSNTIGTSRTVTAAAYV